MSWPPTDAHALQQLLHKYQVLTELADQRAAAISRGENGFTGEPQLRRRKAMRKLAARFPGALRELDTFDPIIIARRMAELQRAIAQPGTTGEPSAVTPVLGKTLSLIKL